MRILSVHEHWQKLDNLTWPTFRLRRRDTDWRVNEEVQVVYRSRGKNRQELGIARIIGKEKRRFPGLSLLGKDITLREAQDDGFTGVEAMKRWMLKTHGGRVLREPLNKITVRWLKRQRRK